MRIVSSWELLTIWNSSNCSLNTRPVCSTSVRRQRVPEVALGSSAAWRSHTLILPSYAPLTMRLLSKRMHRTSSSWPSKTLRQAPHSMSHNLIVLSDEPLTTNLSLYCRQAIPRLWPFNVRTNSHVDVFHTLIVLSPDADTIYLSSKSTTLTAARWPTSTLRKLISVADRMSHTAIDRSFEHVTMRPLLNLRCKTASQWWINVFNICPLFTSHTLTVESLEPVIMTLSSYCRHSTEPVWPVRTCTHCNVWRSQILIVLSRRPLTIFWSSYCRQ